jgi:hypothetical protein
MIDNGGGAGRNAVAERNHAAKGHRPVRGGVG